MLEGTFWLIYNISKYYRDRWDYLKQSHLVSDESVRKIDALLALTDWEIEEKFNKEDNLTEGGKIQTFDFDLIKEAEKRNPAAKQMVFNHVVQRKPVSTMTYNNKNYHAITFEKAMQPPTILFPEFALGSIPNATNFYGRICGIVNYIPNPPPLMNNLALQAVVLAVPMRY